MSARCFDGCTAEAASFRVINNEKSCTRFSGSSLSPSVFHDVEEREGANETSEVSSSVSNAARILLNIEASFRAARFTVLNPTFLLYFSERISSSFAKNMQPGK